MRRASNINLPIPSMPSKKMTPTTIRMILRTPPPWAGGCATGGVGTAETGGDAIAPAIGTEAPHLGQKRVPAARVVPQELQKAMGHLVSIFYAKKFPGRAEYIANSAEVQSRLAPPS